MKFKAFTILTTALLGAPLHAGKMKVAQEDILGVWTLAKFAYLEADNSETNWCLGATGSLAYLPGKMFVAINCTSFASGTNAEELGGKLFYSGPFDFDVKTEEVLHRARNYSHVSLHKTHLRKVEMDSPDDLRLVGIMNAGRKVIVEWKRKEKFSYSNNPLLGVYELVGSENAVEGSNQIIPFCTDFYGSILYTPGGFGAVSINCGDKADPSVVEPADQFGRNYFYSGSYEVAGNIITQNIVNASHVTQIGDQAVRDMTLENDLLTLKGTNGSRFVAKWRKQNSFVGIK